MYRILAMTALLASVLLVACESRPDYESCLMTDQMKQDCDGAALAQQCAASQTDCYVSCVVKKHPQCPGSEESPCMIFQYRKIGETESYSHGPFCTYSCTGDVDCGNGARCMPVLDKQYCVPNVQSTTPL